MTPASQAPATDRSIGELIRDARNLSPAEVEQVLEHQRKHNVRFGEAAIALGLVSADDVLTALAKQFQYPVADAERRQASPELVVLNQPYSARSESFRALRTQVASRAFAQTEGARPALAIVSPSEGDGRSYLAANLAVALAQLGGRTLLIDANLRKPRQHAVFGLADTGGGLSTLLSGRSESSGLKPIDGLPGLFLLPAGPIPPNPLELLERPAFGRVLAELGKQFDQVLIDTPAAEAGADAAVIAARAGAALMVTRQHSSPLMGAQALAAQLGELGVRLIGNVLNAP